MTSSNHTNTKKINAKVAIIGGGTAGLTARRVIAEQTDDYLVIDPSEMKTTCANVGCMPSKVMIQVANDFHRRHTYAEAGIAGANGLSIDGKEVMKHVRSLRDRFVSSVVNDRDWGDKHIRARASFIDEHTLVAREKIIKADNVIIATGSSPVFPPVMKQYKDFIITTDQVFELEDLPRSLAVVGLGVIGIELGQAMARLGVDVTAFSLAKKYGGLSDPAILDYVHESFNSEFNIELMPFEIVSSDQGGVIIKTSTGTRRVEKVLLAIGRSPNVRGLNLEALNIPLEKNGVPAFDTSTGQVKGTRIFIAGDASADRPILHEAADQGRIAALNSLQATPQCFQKRSPLNITFTDPNIAVAGEGYQSLVANKVPFVRGEVTYEGQGRAIVKRKEKGLVHVYAHQQTGQLLGAEMFAPGGEHLAHLLSWAIQFGKTVDEILQAPFYHPVLEEGLRTALRDATSNIKSNKLELVECA